MPKLHRLSFLVVALCASVASAQEKPAAADLSTPKGAALAFANALVAGDAAAIKAASVGTDEEYKTITVLSSMVSAMKRLNDAAIEKFGKENALTKGTPGIDVAADIEKSEIKEEGDVATIVNKNRPDEKNPMRLKKADGKWRVDLTNSLPKEYADQLAKLAPAMARAADDIAKEIKEGKFKTAEEAQQAIGPRMMAAMLEPAPK